jgi:hypothetical protein
VSIWGLSISPSTWTATGALQQLTFGAGFELAPSMDAAGRLLAFASIVSNTDVWSLPVDHKLV